MLRHALAAVTANPSAASRTRASSSSVGDIAPARAQIKHQIYHPLARPMIGIVATAPGGVHGGGGSSRMGR